MYDKDGYYMKQVPVVNLTLRTGYFALDDNLDLMTQGSFRQGSDNVDYTADFDVGIAIKIVYFPFHIDVIGGIQGQLLQLCEITRCTAWRGVSFQQLKSC